MCPAQLCISHNAQYRAWHRVSVDRRDREDRQRETHTHTERETEIEPEEGNEYEDIKLSLFDTPQGLDLVELKRMKKGCSLLSCRWSL